MSTENNTTTTTTETTETQQQLTANPSQPAGRGRVTSTPIAPPVKTTETKIETPTTETDITTETDATGAAETTVTEKTPETTTTTTTTTDAANDDALIKLLKEKGINIDSIDTLKSKVDYVPPPPEPTDDEKRKAELALDKKQLDLFVENGGTIEEYAFLKATANSDVKELSEAEYKKELKAAKFSDEEINAILKERFYQLSDEELEQYEDETEKEFIKRKKDFFANKLANRSSFTINQAKEILDGLKNAITSKELQVQQEKEFSSKVEEHFSKVPRKLTFELGKINNLDIPPMEYEVADEDIAETMDTLKDPTKRKQFFFNSDNTLNLEKVASVMLRNKALESAVKTAYLTGSTRQVEEFQKVFPAHSAHALGVGGAPSQIDRDKGKPTQRGQVQRVRQLTS